jgi:uncharacterized protein (TIGR02246 family)
MTHTRAAAVVMLLALATGPTLPVGSAHTSAPGEAAVEEAVRDLVGRYVDARERRDRTAIRRLFTADADQLTSSGEWRRGRDQVVEGALASSARTGGTRSIQVEHVRMLAPGVALADGRYDISGLEGGSTRRMWTTFVLRLDDGGWKIAAIRNMLPAGPTSATARSRALDVPRDQLATLHGKRGSSSAGMSSR